MYTPNWVDNLNEKLTFVNPTPELKAKFYEGVRSLGKDYFAPIINTPGAQVYITFMPSTEIAACNPSSCPGTPREELAGTTTKHPNYPIFNITLASDYLLADNMERVRNANYFDRPGLWGSIRDFFSPIAWTNWYIVGHEFGHVFDHLKNNQLNYNLGCSDWAKAIKHNREVNTDGYMLFKFNEIGVLPPHR